MIDQRLRESMELVGLVAIVASLVFVGMEIRQDRDLTRAELTAQSFDNTAMLRLSLTNADFANSYAKMLERPDDLTIQERIQVNSLLDAALQMIQRECYLADRKVFGECHGIVSGLARRYFGNKYARSWWRSNVPERASATRPDWIQTELFSYEIDSNLKKLEVVLENM